MGICTSCFKGISSSETVLQPSAEIRRQLQQEAAEKRRIENENRGIKDPSKVKMQQAKRAELERRQEESMRAAGGANLRWQAD